MLSIIMPTLNAETGLARSLPVLARGVIAGRGGQLVIGDGGSSDQTLAMADAAGADIAHAERGRGVQLAEGAKLARGDWLLFVHADTVLAEGWERAVARFIDQAATQADTRRAAVFRFKLDDTGWRARMLEWIVTARTRLLALPYGDQCLLISRAYYDEVGGFKAIPIMEDVDMVRRIGRRRLHVLAHDAVTSAERYHKSGYLRRMGRNLVCISLWFSGVAPERIVRIYQ
jgi:rSAM/selenodomain-associated transferase 2